MHPGSAGHPLAPASKTNGSFRERLLHQPGMLHENSLTWNIEFKLSNCSLSIWPAACSSLLILISLC